MKKNMPFPFHVFLFSIYPAVVLLASNIYEARVQSGIRAILISLIFGILLNSLLKKIIKEQHLSAWYTSGFMVWLFTYGHVYNIFKQNEFFNPFLGRHRFLLPLWLILLILFIWATQKRTKDSSTITQFANFISIFLLLWPTWQITSFIIQDIGYNAQLSEDSPQNSLSPSSENLPDVYYIILDAYSRDDVLASYYDFDNKPFLDQLSEMGFYVASCSRSNYVVTRLSLTSSLNRDFLQELYVGEDDEENFTWRLITHNQVRKDFDNLGFTIISFETGYYWTEWEDADIYLKPVQEGSTSMLGNLQFSNTINGFESLLLETTLFKAFLDLEIINSQDIAAISEQPMLQQFNRVKFTLESIPKIADISEPTFAFIHIVSPHHPYVFDRDGNFTPEGGAYIDQLAYLNTQVLAAVKQILEKSSSPPIIIFQGDHATTDAIGSPDHLNILNAYYFPGLQENPLYETITPVNTFRVLFDTYFDTNLGLLEDISYYSDPSNYSNFKAVPDSNKNCLP